MNWDIFAWVSSAMFLICFMPQLYTTIRYQNVEGINPWMWVALAVAYGTGLVFSLGTWQPPLMANYGPGLIITLIFLGYYFKYKK